MQVKSTSLPNPPPRSLCLPSFRLSLAPRTKKKVFITPPALWQQLTDLPLEMRWCAPAMLDLSKGSDRTGVHVRIGRPPCAVHGFLHTNTPPGDPR